MGRATQAVSAKNVSPAATMLAEQNGIDINKVKGTGSGGMVLKADVQALIDKAAGKKSDKAELDKAAAAVAKENAAKAKAKKKTQSAAAKKKADAKKKREAEREAKKKAREEAKKAREEAKVKREEELAKKEAEQRAKDEAAFKQFQRVDTKAIDVPVSEIRPEELAGSVSKTGASMDHLGFITALLLRELPDTTEEGYNYEIVDGARRYQDAISRRLDVVPAVVMPADTDAATFSAARALTNLARSNNIVHEAEALDSVMKQTGWLLKDVSKYFDISMPTLSKTIKILQLPKDFFDATKEGRISSSVAMELLNLEPELLDKARSVFREKGGLKVKDVREIRKAAKEAKLSGVPAEAFENGEGNYTGTGSGPLGLALNATPEVTFEYAAAALLRAGLTAEDLAGIIDRVAENLADELTEDGEQKGEGVPAEEQEA